MSLVHSYQPPTNAAPSPTQSIKNDKRQVVMKIPDGQSAHRAILKTNHQCCPIKVCADGLSSMLHMDVVHVPTPGCLAGTPQPVSHSVGSRVLQMTDIHLNDRTGMLCFEPGHHNLQLATFAMYDNLDHSQHKYPILNLFSEWEWDATCVTEMDMLVLHSQFQRVVKFCDCTTCLRHKRNCVTSQIQEFR